MPVGGDASKWSARLFVRAVLEGKDDEGTSLHAPMPLWKTASFKSDNGAHPSRQEVEAIRRYLRTVK
jgi:hypothetical protein